MKPVFQTEFGRGKGNCYAACLASILELPINSVPNFCHLYDNNEWMQQANRWCWQFGYGLVLVIGPDDAFANTLAESGGYFIATGPTKREEGLHAVIYHKGVCAHDPMPGGEGLE